jgi:hypothetical protein
MVVAAELKRMGRTGGLFYRGRQKCGELFDMV